MSSPEISPIFLQKSLKIGRSGVEERYFVFHVTFWWILGVLFHGMAGYWPLAVGHWLFFAAVGRFLRQWLRAKGQQPTT
jgi:hypothetical protein